MMISSIIYYTDFVGFLVLSIIWQIAASFLVPLLNSMMSKRTPASQQGALLGASESLSSLGAVIGPLAMGYGYEISPHGPQILFMLGSAGLGLGLWSFTRTAKEVRGSPKI